MGEIEKVFNLIFLDETKQENKNRKYINTKYKFQDFFEFPKLTLSEVREHEMRSSIWSQYVVQYAFVSGGEILQFS